MSLLIALLLAYFVIHGGWGWAIVAVAACFEVVEIWWGLRLAKRRPRVGASTLIGRHGHVVRPLAPEGQIALNGEIWKARSTTHLPAGTEVVVTGREGLTLDVAPDGGAHADGA